MIGGHRVPVAVRVVAVKPLVGLGGAGGCVVYRNQLQRTFAKIGDRVRKTKELLARTGRVLDPEVKRGNGYQVRIMRCPGRASETWGYEQKPRDCAEQGF